MNVLFFGTPKVAVPFLEWLHHNHTIVGVVCQPDKPVGRGYEVHAPAVKEFAQPKGLPIFQPQGRWEESTINALKKTEADIGLAIAYGRIMPEPVFLAPRLGTLNMHFSLLPKYRGAAPMQWALINGERESGVTIFWLEKSMDSGPIFDAEKISIKPEDDAISLEEKLVPLGIKLLAKVFGEIEKGRITKNPQVGEPTFAPLLKKENGQIDWFKDARTIINLIRGVREWPVAKTSYRSTGGTTKKLKIFSGLCNLDWGGTGQPGQILASTEAGIGVQTGGGVVFLKEVQPEGKKPMPAWAFWQGAHLKVGDKFF